MKRQNLSLIKCCSVQSGNNLETFFAVKSPLKKWGRMLMWVIERMISVKKVDIFSLSLH